MNSSLWGFTVILHADLRADFVVEVGERAVIADLAEGASSLLRQHYLLFPGDETKPLLAQEQVLAALLLNLHVSLREQGRESEGWRSSNSINWRGRGPTGDLGEAEVCGPDHAIWNVKFP